ncbi:hypothetical protein [Aliivibrio fischeri]|uniref:hypothetical protein n=1 Tax=Aliivibrio fischeri TaxID=668 RepID=UPI00080E40A3|nr:hypothetical protein [Aliivibrio fischeri]OCH03713.1 hypothetical protein A6E11_18890 [Aliivibrio fischeri]
MGELKEWKEIIAALIAFFAVIISQFCLFFRTRTDHRNEQNSIIRQEKLKKVEEIFEILLQIRMILIKDNLIKESDFNDIPLERMKVIAKASDKSLKDILELKMKLRLLILMYTPELIPDLINFESNEDNFGRVCFDYIRTSNAKVGLYAFIERKTKVIESLNHLQTKLSNYPQKLGITKQSTRC